jgi:multidrug efflux pump
VFGLGFATILTLVVTPAALMLIANLSEARQRRREARAAKKEAKLQAKATAASLEAKPAE